MPQKRYNHTQCFEHYGVKPRNVMWSWSGRSEDGGTVAVTLWQDLFEEQGRVYRIRNIDPAYDYQRQPGLAELKDNLAHALAHNDGLVRVIVAIAKDVKASPRSIKECFPADRIVMRVTDFDSEQGTATLVRVEPSA
jgi:hypothetical protein